MSVFTVVKENVTAKQVAEHYGFRVNRNNMMWRTCIDMKRSRRRS